MSPSFNALGVDADLNIEFLPLAVVNAADAFELAVPAAELAAAAAFYALTIESYVLPEVI